MKSRKLVVGAAMVGILVLLGVLWRPICGCGAEPPSVFAQQGPGRGPIGPSRDEELEKQSYHNLEVAKFYFYKRKPDKNNKESWVRLNKSIEDRLNEILDTNPNFARISEVYFMLGELYKRTGELEKAVENWTKAVREDADQKVKADAQKRLEEAKSQTRDKDKGGVTN